MRLALDRILAYRLRTTMRFTVYDTMDFSHRSFELAWQHSQCVALILLALCWMFEPLLRWYLYRITRGTPKVVTKLQETASANVGNLRKSSLNSVSVSLNIMFSSHRERTRTISL